MNNTNMNNTNMNNTNMNNINTCKYMDNSVLLCGRKQDYIVMGTCNDVNERQFDWSVTVDGHGTNSFINIIKKTDFVPFMIQNDPIKHIIEHFRSLNGTYLDDGMGLFTKNNKYKRSSGCTIIIVKIYDDLIEGAIIGDSRCAVYIDDEEVFISTPHNIKNLLEVERLSDRPSIVNDFNGDKIIQIIGDNKGIVVPSIYTTFEDNTRMALTQALGHDCITGFEAEKFSFKYNKEQHLRFVSGSDGFWDMQLNKRDIMLSGNDIIINHLMDELLPDITQDNEDILKLTAVKLTQKALKRWAQVWNVYMDDKDGKYHTMRTSYPTNGYDDICVFVWDNMMNQEQLVECPLL